MKLKTTLLASLFSAIAASSIGAQAAPEMDKTAEVKTPVASVQTDKTEPSKKHSHVEEKTGIQTSISPSMTNQTDPTKDKNRHLHPRDGK